MDISLPGIPTAVGGTHAIVVIGPNGVGKTQLGVAITRANDGERIAALRNVEISEIPMQRLAQASEQVRNVLSDLLGNHWRQSYELQHLMSEIVAEHREISVKYREQHMQNPSATLDQTLADTRLEKIVRIWNRHFPGRTINISYEPEVKRVANGKTYKPYPIAHMSEGERTALYLAARVISCRKNVIVVDEPETFFHPLLARNLWNDLEVESPNLRFVYITHDIPFALSRKGAQFAIARSEDRAELLPPTSSIPADVIGEVLGAASFSITASRLIFCEGNKPKSLDNPMLSAWHDCEKTAIIPVGSCTAVRECVSVFRKQQVAGGLEALGYIDRDGWPDEFLNEEPFVKAHIVSEIEGLFCLEDVFKALAKYQGFEPDKVEGTYTEFIAEAARIFDGVLLNKEILNRSKKRVEVQQKALFNPIKPQLNLTAMRTAFAAVEPSSGWPTYLANVFSDEEQRLKSSLATGGSDLIRDFPAKSYLSAAARHLRFVEDQMVKVFGDALRLTDEVAKKEDKLRTLRDELVLAISPYMWSRKA